MKILLHTKKLLQWTNSVKLQITKSTYKNLLCFYTLKNYQKDKKDIHL